MTISTELQEVYANATGGLDYVECLIFSHSQFPKTYYLTNDTREWKFHLKDGTPKVFEPFPFNVSLPSQEKGSNPELSIVLSNAGLDMMNALELAQETPSEPISITYSVYVNTENSIPALDPSVVLEVTNIIATDTALALTANRFDVLGRQFPKRIYTTELFEGLKR